MYDRVGTLLGTDTEPSGEIEILEWDGTSLSAGLYKFELDLTPGGGNLQTFKGQFIVKE